MLYREPKSYILTKFLVQVRFTIPCGDKIITVLKFLL